MVDIVNAAPMVYDLGINDLSTRQIPVGPMELPQHLPKFWTYAQKGRVGSTYVDLDEVSPTKLYGEETFKSSGIYYTHQSPFIQAAVSAANNVVIHRVVPSDINDVSNICFWLQVVPSSSIPVYERDDKGRLKKDPGGNNIQTGTAHGYELSWVVTHEHIGFGGYEPGTQEVNDIPAPTPGGDMYPIFEFWAKDPGEYGNLMGVKLFSPDNTQGGFDSDLLNQGKMYPVTFGMSKVRDLITNSPVTVTDRYGSTTITGVLKRDAIHPKTGAVAGLVNKIKNQYIEIPENMSTDLGGIAVYSENLEEVLLKVYEAELEYLNDPANDVNGSSLADMDWVDNGIFGSIIYDDPNVSLEDCMYGFNILGLTHSSGAKYFTSVFELGVQDGVQLVKNTSHRFEGGDDGTIDLADFEGAVLADLENYENPLHPYNDLVAHPESVIYDSGFSLEVKTDGFFKFISRRYDTFVVMTPYEFKENTLGQTDIPSLLGIANMLKEMYAVYPESATFGTPTARALIVMGTGYLDPAESNYIYRVPLTYELCHKAARYMGAKNGAWKNGFSFDRAPGSIVTKVREIDVTWVPTSTRNDLWKAGINFVLNYQIRRQFFPALQTVYENDTSVLNSFFTVVAITYLNKIAHSAWREFTGAVSLTNAQLEEQVNEFVSRAVKDKFDSMFTIIPKCTVTELDEIRGYSWTLPIEIYANVSKTVMTTYVEAYRMEDLGG